MFYFLQCISKPSFQTTDLQQELNNLTSQLTVLQTEQKQLQKKVRRSERYYLSKETQRRSAGIVNQNIFNFLNTVPHEASIK
jgi:sensor histidine kinase YesM